MTAATSKESRLGVVDYLLVCIASCLATFSAGRGLNVPEVSGFFVILTVIATFVGYIMHRVLPARFALADGFFYAAFAIAEWFYKDALNAIVPSGGFPDTLLVAAWLCWMVVFGSLCMWRDSTLLFQAVPGIAIFGYVGTWDTFRYAPFMFFGFLLCFATLFARAHSRDMMLRARESGYVPTSLDANKPGGFQRALRAGPWRWMAGPEWAMLSALLVVVISVVGGPFLQFSLQGVAGSVRLPQPPTPAMRKSFFGPLPSQSTNFIAKSGETVGTGPRHELDGKPIFTARMPMPAYMKMHTFLAYDDRGWQEIAGQPSIRGFSSETSAEFDKNVHPSNNFTTVPFILTYVDGSYDSIPIPGDLNYVEEVPKEVYRVDGTVPNEASVFSSRAQIGGEVIVPNGTSNTADTQDPYISNYSVISDNQISPRVLELAKQVTKRAKNDREKADAIMDAISHRCVYDLGAPAVPAGQDPVDYFLFESKRGYCDLFASAMTVMARAAGLPARYVIGFAPFTQPAPVNGTYTFYDTDYHAWSEIYFKNTGWQIYDATGDAAEAPGAGRGSKLSGTPWYALATFRLSFITLGIVLCGWALGNLLAKYRRTSIFRRRVLPELERSYADLVRLVESKTGKPRRPSQTPHEYLVAVKPLLDGSYEAFGDATNAFVSIYYSSPEPSQQMVSDFGELVRRARAALKPIKRPKDVRPEK